MSSNQTLYAPLVHKNSIRLLILEPGVATDHISVQLHEYEARYVPAYDAISYVWGDPEETTEIFCNGSIVHITRNLHWALTRLRKEDEPVCLWADALCINQGDVDERSHQVAIMGEIYANARIVYVCIGEDEDGGAQGIASLLEKLASGEAFHELDSVGTGRSLAGIPQSSLTGLLHLVEESPTRQDNGWYAVGDLLRMPWFSRVWVLQEVGLARQPRVLYGTAEFSYRLLMAAIKYLNIHGRSSNYGVATLLIHTEWADWTSTEHPTTRSPYTFLDLLDHAALLSCKDPRDRVYAFLGHPSCKGEEGIGSIVVPDYRKDTLVVFKEASEFLLMKEGLRSLASVEHTSATVNDDCPTWVARWDVSNTVNNIYSRPGRFSASAGHLPLHRHSIQDGKLQVEGVVIGEVQMAFPVGLAPQGDSVGVAFKGLEDLLLLEDLIKYLETNNTPCAYGAESRVALALTLLAWPNFRNEASGVMKNFTAYRNWHNTTWIRPFFRKLGKLDQVVNYGRAMTSVCYGRSFVVTREGHYGLGPRITEPGDMCCVLFGSDVPFVLRRRETGQEGFKFVGECYLQGFMEGQAITKLHNGMAERTVFNIH